MSHPEPAAPSVFRSDLSPGRRRAALTSGEVPVAVYGLGKMGLPLAAVLADVSGNVTGIDVDPDVVSAVEAGESPVTGEPDLPGLVAETAESGALSATTDPVPARVHVVVVPTLIDDGGDPDLSNLEAAVRAIGGVLEGGDLVVVESTVPPGTCKEVVVPLLSGESGLPRGSFGVAFCPERTSSGRALRDIRGSYPKVVGGVDDASTEAASLVYGEVTSNEVIATDARTAEAVKVFEGVYRDVNIALANELGRLAGDLGVDVRETIEVANTQPYCDLHSPGPGVGGHCIPYYPHFLTAAVDGDPSLVSTARAINTGMPAHTVELLANELSRVGRGVSDASVAVLGLTYRPGVAETQESPAREVATLLDALGATVYGVDPLLDAAPDFDLELVPQSDLPALSADLDAAVVVTPHEEFADVEWEALDRMVVLDGRGELDLEDTHHVVHTLGEG